MHAPDAQTLQVLHANPWFASLPQPEQAAMLAVADYLQVPRGGVLYRKGSRECNFYGLLRGVVKVSSVGSDGREGILSLVEAGVWFNESSMLDEQTNTHDATALEDIAVLVISPEGFARLLQRLPFVLGIARLEVQRLRILFGMVEDTMVRDVGARVARRLLLLAHGDATMASQARARVLVSQDALAMMLGVTRQTLWKEVRVLVKAGVLALGYGRIDILDVPALQRLADRP